MGSIVEIETYNPLWEQEFYALRDVIDSAMGQCILSIEHVGSTSVRGLGAKPILDIDIVIDNDGVLPVVIQHLEKIGYFHQEEWSFHGREAFGRKDASVPWCDARGSWIEHHLYVCDRDSEELARHLAFRNYLRKHPEAVEEYDRLKRHLAKTAQDRASYTLGKTNFVQDILKRAMQPPNN